MQGTLHFGAPSATSQDEEPSTSSATQCPQTVWSWGWRPIYLYFSPARLRWVCVRVCVCGHPCKAFCKQLLLCYYHWVWVMFCTINTVNNVCILIPLCSPLETPRAASSLEDEPLCTDLLTGLQFWLWEFRHNWFPGDQVRYHLTLYSLETTVTEEVATISTSGSHWLVGKIYLEVGWYSFCASCTKCSKIIILSLAQGVMKARTATEWQQQQR